MTILDFKKKYHKKIDSFDLDIIISIVIKKNREYILSYPEKELNKTQESKIRSLIKKRQSMVPLAYIVGYKEFYSNKFIVNKNVLVPRPETELIVEEAIEHTTRNTKHKTIIDLGTGSGCIIISLAKELKKEKNIDFYGIDISLKALNIAKKNAKLNNVENKIKFIRSDLLTKIQKPLIKNLKSQIIITANLPYLNPTQIKESPTIKKEPRIALVAGQDGLKYYHQLFKQISNIHKINSNTSFTIFCEIDPAQTKPIKSLAKKIFENQYKLEIKKDLRGLNRFVIISI